jgi:translation elongation factor EF-Ts
VNEIALDDGRTLADAVAMEVGNLGENMLLRRGVFMSCVDNAASVLGHYIHTSGTGSTRP